MKLDAHGQPIPRLNEARTTTKAVAELLGMCRGFVADHHLSSAEILSLANWLSRNMTKISQWPIDEISTMVATILDDGEISEEETAELKALLIRAIGGDPNHTQQHSTQLAAEEVPDPIEFADRSFCFTGKFHFGERKLCQSVTTQMGGVIQKAVTNKLDYLVIGTLASRDWVQTSHGRKIEAAIANRANGATTRIISEEHWRLYITAKPPHP